MAARTIAGDRRAGEAIPKIKIGARWTMMDEKTARGARVPPWMMKTRVLTI